MRIKTITCHNVYNLGASLQAFALEKYLEMLGHDVEIIDYQPIYLQHYRLLGVSNPRYDRPFLKEAYQIAKLPGRLYDRLTSKRKKNFDKFSEEYLRSTAERYSNSDELAASPPHADIYVAGSDQIWNPLFKNGKDPAFFLNFAADSGRRISYAASMAVEELSADDVVRMKLWLSRFDAISVRESSAVRILSGMGLRAVQSVDPVFLLPPEIWCNIAVLPETSGYILVYDFDRSEIVQEIVESLSKRTGKKIVSLFPVDWADAVIGDAGPREFLGAVLNADIVVSNSFHATAFSIIFQKDFYVVGRTENINSRMSDLVQDLEITDRMISSIPQSTESVDYSRVIPILNRKIEDSKNYLSVQISSVK